MTYKNLTAMGTAVLLFFLTIFAVGPVTEKLVQSCLNPEILNAASVKPMTALFQGTLLQQAALKAADTIPIYGSSEFGHGGAYNPARLFAGDPTGWHPYLVGHAGSRDIIQALYAGAQDLKGEKIVLSLSPQWFGSKEADQKSFAANFSALQAYKMVFNADLSPDTKKDLAKRLLEFKEVKENYPILKGLLADYGKADFLSRLMETVYWPAGHLDMAAMEIQDTVKTMDNLKNLPAAYKVKNQAVAKLMSAGPDWAALQAKAEKDVRKDETNNSFGINNKIYEGSLKSGKGLKNSQRKGRLFPSSEYADLDLLMRVLKDEGAEPMFLIQPVNGRWYDYVGFPKAQRQKYYQAVRSQCQKFGYAVADFSGHEYDPHFMDDSSHPSEKGWLEFDEALDHFVHQKS